MKMKAGATYSLVILAIVILLTAPAARAACDPQARIVVFGDSLVAGFGLDPGEAFPEQLEKALQAKGHAVAIANAGVSGDTSTGGLARLDWSVPDDTDLVILELGANDALRGIPVELTRRNLDQMVARLTDRRIAVLLAGMLAPPNMGQDYGTRFGAIYPDLAQKHGVSLYPFFLDGVAADPGLNLEDGIHPNSAGIAEIVKRIVPVVTNEIDRICRN